LDQFMFDEYYTVLDSTPEFRSKIRRLGELVERRAQIVYLIAILLLYTESEFINIMKIRAEDIHIFRSPTSYPNIAYSAIKYKKDKFRRGNIIAICKLVNKKLKEYPALAKIIIYSSSIITT
ncbi:hypothetical protein BKA64DRAFT_568436, partial [Cadophora sp. MPI-SDFR-AT-0126]